MRFSPLLAALAWGCVLPPPPEPVDGDRDGVAAGEDCDDFDASAFPGAMERCDGVDNDCDGEVDEDASDRRSFWPDGDDDGFGTGDAVTACEPPEGHARAGGDCDDGDPLVHPGAAERCNGADDDCDGVADDTPDIEAWVDGDGDGWGDPGQPGAGCGAGWATRAGDCDDSDAAVHPDAAETCNTVDDDCDGAVDDDDPGLSGAPTWYPDADLDGYATAAVAIEACDPGVGWSAELGDCDDWDEHTWPGAREVCDGADNGCAGGGEPADAWWDPRWRFRVPVAIDVGPAPVAGPPVLLEVDFAALRAAVGDTDPLDPRSVVAVLHDCGQAGAVVLPTQFEEALWGLGLGVDPADPVGDERGTVAFVVDRDGDLDTVDTLAAGTQLEVGLYWGGPPAPPSSSDLQAGALTLDNDAAAASFDPQRGGLLDALEVLGASHASLADATRGNGVSTPSGVLFAQDAPAPLDLIAAGPALGVLSSVVVQASADGAVSTEWTWWRFARRPEVWVSVFAQVTSELTVQAPTDAVGALRPLALVAPGLTTPAWQPDPVGSAGDLSDGVRGVHWGWVAAPQHDLGFQEAGGEVWSVANDALAPGGGSVAVLAAGTVLVDHRVAALLPYVGAPGAAAEAWSGLHAGVTPTPGTPEAY